MKFNKVDIEIKVVSCKCLCFIFVWQKPWNVKHISSSSAECHVSRVTCHVSRVTASPAAPGATRPRAGCGSSLPPPILGWIQYYYYHSSSILTSMNNLHWYSHSQFTIFWEGIYGGLILVECEWNWYACLFLSVIFCLLTKPGFGQAL